MRKPAAERAVGHETDPEFLESRQDLTLRFTPPQRILVLERGDGLNRVRATERRHARLRHPEVTDLAFANEFLDCAGDILDGDVGIDAMLIEEIDVVGLQPSKRGLDHVPDVRGPAVEPLPARAAVGIQLEAELRRNDHALANGRQRFPEQRFVRERTVRLGGVKERDAAIHDSARERDHLRLVLPHAIRSAHPHRSQSRQAKQRGSCTERDAFLLDGESLRCAAMGVSAAPCARP